MRLATSTCIFPGKREGGRTPLEESIRLCYDCGFRVIDLNFCSASNPKSNSELVGDDWERNVDRLGELAAELGITYNQSHAPYDSNL